MSPTTSTTPASTALTFSPTPSPFPTSPKDSDLGNEAYISRVSEIEQNLVFQYDIKLGKSTKMNFLGISLW